MADNKKFIMDGTPIGAIRTHRNSTTHYNEETRQAGNNVLSAEALKKLSEVRRNQISSFQPAPGGNSGGGAGGGIKKDGNSFTSPAIAYKKADFSSSFSSGGHSVERMMPEIYSPLFQVANLNLPRDRMTMNAWNRNFYDTNPIVRNAITLHATYPISKINIKSKNRKIEQFFNDQYNHAIIPSVKKKEKHFFRR